MPEGLVVGLPAPTRDFLDEERGVILLFRNALTGVRSSWEAALALEVLGVVLRVVRLVCVELAEAMDGASRGVSGDLTVRVVASAGFRGRPLLLVLERSVCMVQLSERTGDYRYMLWMWEVDMIVASGNGRLLRGRCLYLFTGLRRVQRTRAAEGAMG